MSRHEEAARLDDRHPPDRGRGAGDDAEPGLLSLRAQGGRACARSFAALCFALGATSSAVADPAADATAATDTGTHATIHATIHATTRATPDATTENGIEAGPTDAGSTEAASEANAPEEYTASYAVEYDPNAGIDSNGRIPAIVRPAEIANSERWRYIPEAKIKPGNVFQRFMVSSFIAPFVFRQADIGYGFGIAITDIDFREQRRREFAGISGSYTTEGQMAFNFNWRRRFNTVDLPGGGVLQDERSFLGFSARFEKTLTRRYFGIGPDTPKDDESSYTDQAFKLSFGGSRGFEGRLENVVLTGELRGEIHELSAGRRDPSMDIRFPADFEADEHHDIGFVSAGLRYDTRDSQRNPYEGWHADAEIDFAPAQSGGAVGALYTFRTGTVFRTPPLLHDGGDDKEENPPTDILAFGLRSQLSSGSLPFFQRPTLGGSRFHRGFIDGRFRDDTSWLAAAEYRFWVIPRGFGFSPTIRIERIGLAVFYEVGAVAPAIDAFADAKPRHSYGVGLRISLERAAPFRLDLGFSEDGVNFAAGFGLSF